MGLHPEAFTEPPLDDPALVQKARTYALEALMERKVTSEKDAVYQIENSNGVQLVYMALSDSDHLFFYYGSVDVSEVTIVKDITDTVVPLSENSSEMLWESDRVPLEGIIEILEDPACEEVDPQDAVGGHPAQLFIAATLGYKAAYQRRASE